MGTGAENLHRQRPPLRSREALHKLEVATRELGEYKEEIHACKQKLFEQEQALKVTMPLTPRCGLRPAPTAGFC